MKISASIVSSLIVGSITANAFAPTNVAPLAFHSKAPSSDAVTETALSMSMSEELGIPCEDDCALESYADLPDSVHPGVLSGQAQVDLLNHAKENGKL
jgi:fructose-bisphosphate aldolase class II